MGHDERTHSTLSPSGAYRWLVCTPSALLERQFPDTTSEAAAEGTVAHELAELKLRNYCQSVDFGKRKLTAAVKEIKKNPLWKDEMEGYTDIYLDYIKSAALAFVSEPTVKLEARISLSAYIPHLPDEDEASGSADCILIGGKTIHVIDFKYGKSPDGRVEAEGNPQLALYALGAYSLYKLLYPIEEVKMSIVQPRLSDGISEWGCSVKELLAFGDYVKRKADMAIKGEGDFAPSHKTCKYCRLKGQCRARAEANVKLVFDIGKKPPLITNEEVGEFLKQGEDVAKWLSDLQDYALKECLAGKEVSGWKAVEGRGARAWTDMDTAFSVLIKSGLTDESLLWNREPLTLAEVEKLVGKKDFADIVGEYVVKSPGKPTLVKEIDKREAITNKITAAEAFDIKERN